MRIASDQWNRRVGPSQILSRTGVLRSILRGAEAVVAILAGSSERRLRGADGRDIAGLGDLVEAARLGLAGMRALAEGGGVGPHLRLRPGLAARLGAAARGEPGEDARRVTGDQSGMALDRLDRRRVRLELVADALHRLAHPFVMLLAHVH